jgi:hypothetical protein
MTNDYQNENKNLKKLLSRAKAALEESVHKLNSDDEYLGRRSNEAKELAEQVLADIEASELIN